MVSRQGLVLALLLLAIEVGEEVRPSVVLRGGRDKFGCALASWLQLKYKSGVIAQFFTFNYQKLHEVT